MESTNGTRRILVTGAGGFIGHHLVKHLKAQGAWVRGVDIRRPEFEGTAADEFLLADLRQPENCARTVQGIQDVYQLAADMGGIGYISLEHASISRNNILINAHMLESSRAARVDRYLFTSSACTYPSFLQNDGDVQPLRETDAIPADPEKGYGWEKLFAEQLTTYFQEDYGLDTRIVRFHNIYGPMGTYEGGREKAPAALCRKVAESADDDAIEIWGDGEQTRTFCYVDDCVEGLVRIMESGYEGPLNLGTAQLVTINELVGLIGRIAGKRLRKVHNRAKPQGVRGRSSDNTLLRKVLGWEPETSLGEGLSRTYAWIWSELAKRGRASPPTPKSFEEFPELAAIAKGNARGGGS